MSVMTIEGIVDYGQIKLKGDVRLPEKTRVYVVVPDEQVYEIELKRDARISRPRLANPEDAKYFRLEVIEGTEGGRPFGLAKGEFVVSEDFDAPLLDSIINEFEGRKSGE